MSLSSVQLLVAASYAIDMSPTGNAFHGWQTALLSQELASRLIPEMSGDVFLAGLLHEAGGVGTRQTVVGCLGTVHTDNTSTVIQRSSALVRWLPGATRAADLLVAMHLPFTMPDCLDEKRAKMIFTGGQVLRAADAVSTAGCLNSESNLAKGLKQLCGSTGTQWSRDVWTALVDTLRCRDTYHRICDKRQLPENIATLMSELKMPQELLNEKEAHWGLNFIAALVDIKTPSTRGHSLRASNWAEQLASIHGLSAEECTQVRWAGLIHDCGRLGVSSMIMNNSGRLNSKQLETVRKHASMTIEAMNCLPGCQEMAELGWIGGHDHERYDGTGYPDRMKAEQIPVLSRVLSVVDAFDAMIAPCDYRILSPKAALLRLQQGAGSQFDPELVEAMVKAVNEGTIEIEAMKRAA